jgi:hypothetical protein
VTDAAPRVRRVGLILLVIAVGICIAMRVRFMRKKEQWLQRNAQKEAAKVKSPRSQVVPMSALKGSTVGTPLLAWCRHRAAAAACSLAASRWQGPQRVGGRGGGGHAVALTVQPSCIAAH